MCISILILKSDLTRQDWRWNAPRCENNSNGSFLFFFTKGAQRHSANTSGRRSIKLWSPTVKIMSCLDVLTSYIWVESTRYSPIPVRDYYWWTGCGQRQSPARHVRNPSRHHSTRRRMSTISSQLYSNIESQNTTESSSWVKMYRLTSPCLIAPSMFASRNFHDFSKD